MSTEIKNSEILLERASERPSQTRNVRIWVIRHGKPEPNTGKLSTPDTPLSPEGAGQAQKFARLMREEQQQRGAGPTVIKVFFSGYRRTKETALAIVGEWEKIIKEQGLEDTLILPSQSDEALLPVNTLKPVMEGLHVSQDRAQVVWGTASREELEAIGSQPPEAIAAAIFGLIGRESMLEDVSTNHPDIHLVFVTHDTSHIAILKLLLAPEPPPTPIDYIDPLLFEFDPDGTAYCTFRDDIMTLPALRPNLSEI